MVPGVEVTLTSADTNQARTTKTGADGVYKFSLVPPGNYKVRFSVTGFKVAEVSAVALIKQRLGGSSGGPGYFNASAFCAGPAIRPDGVTVTTQAACPTCATLFGSSGAGILLGPGQVNFHASLLKTTKGYR